MNWGSEPVLLVRVYDPVEADIIAAKLRSAGIECLSRYEALSVVYGLTVDGFGQRDIMVRAEDLEEAQAALETDEMPEAAWSDRGDPDEGDSEAGDPETAPPDGEE